MQWLNKFKLCYQANLYNMGIGCQKSSDGVSYKGLMAISSLIILRDEFMATHFYISGIIAMAAALSACSTPAPKTPSNPPKSLPSKTTAHPTTQVHHLPALVQKTDHRLLTLPVGSQQHFMLWFDAQKDPQVATYQSYLGSYLPRDAVPPMRQLLTTARSWQSCGEAPYQVPPQHLWNNMLPTLRLYDELKKSNILPANTEIRSVYRNPTLNVCAGGAPASKHLNNSAIDIWVPDVAADSLELYQIQNKLCDYWLRHGERHAFGLGLYATGAIHLDTQGYRKWGAQFSEPTSVCRYSPTAPSVSTVAADS